jgi:LVIVD repeat
MPIRVNLKEIFPSDPQEINVDKVNFNFNKLLELGVGTPGPIGLTGPQGAAGPVGLTGPQGERGATWWVDAGDPNLLTFTGLIDGDLYLDTVNFNAWQWDAGSSTWTQIASISSIINNYLSSNPAVVSPFVTGVGLSTGTIDNRYIVFRNRGDLYSDYTTDTTRGAINSSNNNVLFLNNFNEETLRTALTLPNLPLNFPSDPNVLYDAILKVFVSHAASPSANEAGRYHAEFGSLYENTLTGETELSQLKHNLKFKFLKNDVSASTSIPSTNTWINTARYSLSTPDTSFPSIDQNGIFEFIIPKYNNEGMSSFTDEIKVLLGPAESAGEYSNTAGILADGIMITSSTASVTVGLKNSLEELLNIPYSAGNANFAFFDISSGLDGFFFNDDLIQTGGNFKQIITTGPVQLDFDSFYSMATTGHFMSQGIWVSSNTIWLASGAGNTTTYTSTGIIQRYDISNPKNPLKGSYLAGNKGNSLAPGYTSNDQHGHDLVGALPIGLIKDIAEYGKYVITVHHRGSTLSGDKRDLFIHETDSLINGIRTIGSITDSALTDAYRVQVHGKYAWVITNRTYSPGTGPQTQGGTLVKAKLTSVDISDPLNPAVSDSFEEADNGIVPGEGTKYLDFDIKDGKAFVLRYTNYVATSTPPNSTHALDLLLFDVQDPTNFSSLFTYTYNPPFDMGTSHAYSPQDSVNLETLVVNTTRTEFGGIDTLGSLAYVVWEDNLYISEVVSNNLILRSTTSLSAESMNACDVLVKGNYAYVLVNYTDSTGAVQIWDISDKNSPFMTSETRNANLANSSRLSISGKYIYVVSNTGTSSELITLDITGIDSPAAQIGALKTDDLQVNGNVHIKNNLQVKNSLNVGPGGIYIDRGQGLSSDGLISSKINSDNLTAYSTELTGTLSDVSITASRTSISNVTQASTVGNIVHYLNQTLFTNSEFADVLYLNYTNFATNHLAGAYNQFADTIVANRIGSSGLGFGSSNQFADFYGTTIQFGGSLSSLIATVGDNFSGSFVGSQIALSKHVTIDTHLVGYRMTSAAAVSGDVYGLDLTIGYVGGTPPLLIQPGIVTGNVYAIKANVNSSKVTGTAYGLHIQGADENIIEGNIDFSGEFKNTSGSISSIRNTAVDGPESTAVGENVISSGRYYLPGNNSNNWATGTNFQINWIRVGDVVHCHFRGVLDALDTSGSVIGIPHTDIIMNLVEGHGIIEHIGLGSAPSVASSGKIRVVEHFQGPSYPAVRLEFLNAAGGNIQVGLNTNDANATVRGSFSYLIQ